MTPLPLSPVRHLGSRTLLPLRRICASPMLHHFLSHEHHAVSPSSSIPTGTRSLATPVRHSKAIYESDRGKERVVILGSGWGGYTLSRKVSPESYSPLIVSPRSYFVFTPLLTDTASGSLDFSNIVEPVRDPKSNVDFVQAAAHSIDLQKKTVLCEATVVKSGVTETPRTHEHERLHDETPETGPKPPVEQRWERGEFFEVPYDKLVIAVGAVSTTFQTPGVRHNAMFFKDIGDAKRVKRRVRECFELAVLPTTTPEMRRSLLHFAIVGAGPTGTELAASLRDFIYTDLIQLYPALKGIPCITLYDIAPMVLSMFDESLSRYAMDTMRREGISIKTSHHIKGLRWGAPWDDPPHEMDPKRCLTLKTEEEGDVGVGMCVWVTGNTMNRLVSHALQKVSSFPTASALMKDGQAPSSDIQNPSWQIKKAPKSGALLVDGQLRLQLESDDGRTAVLQDVFALGDNAMPETGAPPATAQATAQEAKWLAERFNRRDIQQVPPFSFKNMGALAYIGDSRALMQIPHEKTDGKRNKYLPEGLKGRTAWVVWNSAYLTMSISWRNKLRVLFRWMLNNVFGRDISRY
ncbi:Pyridine nucleotide-disulfide oxidoreductase [Aspergillus sp. HF37]|nr:Pyridine nucleotide-disulfide oxidoreductase [Aspergillus sp. HF37]